MKRLFWQWVSSSVALLLAVAVVHAHISPWYQALWIAPLLGLVSGVVGAVAGIISFLALPVNLLTLGCFGFILSFLLYTLAIYGLCGPQGPLSTALLLDGGHPFLTAVELAVLMAIFSSVLNIVLPGRREEQS